MTSLSDLKKMAGKKLALGKYFDSWMLMQYYYFRKYELACKAVNCRGPMFWGIRC